MRSPSHLCHPRFPKPECNAMGLLVTGTITTGWKPGEFNRYPDGVRVPHRKDSPATPKCAYLCDNLVWYVIEQCFAPA